MKPLAKLPRVLQPAKGFNTRRTHRTLTLTRQNPYPSLRVRVSRVRVRVAPENPRVTRANHYLPLTQDTNGSQIMIWTMASLDPGFELPSTSNTTELSTPWLTLTTDGSSVQTHTPTPAKSPRRKADMLAIDEAQSLIVKGKRRR